MNAAARVVALSALIWAGATLGGCDDEPQSPDGSGGLGAIGGGFAGAGGGQGGAGATGGQGGAAGQGGAGATGGQGGAAGQAGSGGAAGQAGSGGAAGQAGSGGAAGQAGSGGAAGQAGSGGAGATPGEPQFRSLKGNLRFKRGVRLQREFARILRLSTDELCAEFGRYDCIEQIHRLTLGGVEPYQANIYEPFEATAISAPLAVERIALSACILRVSRDADNLAEAEIFRGVQVTADGRIADIESAPVVDAISRLFTRALLRRPSAEDIADMQQLYRDIEASGVSDGPAFDWAVLSCMTTLTSIESLFY